MHLQEEPAGGDPDELGPLLLQWPAVVNRLLNWMEGVKCNADGLGFRPIDILGHNEKWRAARASGHLRPLAILAENAQRLALSMGADDGPTTWLLDLLNGREMPEPATIASAADAVQRQLTQKRVASKPLVAPRPAPQKMATERSRPSMEVTLKMVPQVLQALRSLKEGSGKQLPLDSIASSDDPRAKAIRWGKLHLDPVADALVQVQVPAFKMELLGKYLKGNSATAVLHILCALVCGRSIGAAVAAESQARLTESVVILGEAIREADLIRLEKQVELEMGLLRELEAGSSLGDGVAAPKVDAVPTQMTSVPARKPLHVLYALHDLLVDASSKDERAGADAHALIFGDGNLYADLVSISKRKDEYAQAFGGSTQPTIKWAPCNGHHALAWWCEMLANLTKVRSETIPRVRADLVEARKRGDQVRVLECEGSVRKAEVYFATAIDEALGPILKDYDWIHQSLRREVEPQSHGGPVGERGQDASRDWVPAALCIGKLPDLKDHTAVRRFCRKHGIETRKQGGRRRSVHWPSFQKALKLIEKKDEEFGDIADRVRTERERKEQKGSGQ